MKDFSRCLNTKYWDVISTNHHTFIISVNVYVADFPSSQGISLQHTSPLENRTREIHEGFAFLNEGSNAVTVNCKTDKNMLEEFF